jgi:hypothetical protein
MNENKREMNQTPLSSVIDKLLKAYGLSNKMKEIEIISKWEELMGKAVATRTESIKIHNQILHLQLNSSVMRDELLNGKNVIIERINQTAGYQIIRDVWLS